MLSNEELRAKLGAMSPADVVPYINGLVYAEAGTGKTYFLGTAQDHPQTTPALIADVEGGTLTLRDRPDIDVVKIRSMKQLENLYDELEKNPGYYKFFGVDSVTELQKLDMHDVMDEAKRTSNNPEKVDLLVPSQREWGKSNERIRQILRAIRDLPMHTFVTALRGSVELPGGGRSYFASLPGKLAMEVPGFFDIVGYMKADAVAKAGEVTITRTMQTVKTSTVSAKDRTGALGQSVTDPSIPLLWEMIYGQ